ncbi:MAG: MBOAT family O-acyltransferase [Bacteroidota bacterium]
MLFNSLHFVAFFLIVTPIYFWLPQIHKWKWLLAISCYFYMIFLPIYILILGFTIVIDYFAGIYIEKTIGSKRKLYLIISLIANIGVLAVFKYYNFLNEILTTFINKAGYYNPAPILTILLPVGLSFHTFQAMSYTIEVFRGNQKAERHFGIYALYVMFYPQLVAGPIERPQNILHQFYEKHSFEYQRVADGLKQMAWGFFKKIVVADRLAVFVNTVYNSPGNYEGFPLIVATIFFSIQIYCDFSGYSDIAIGAAKVMGFKLMKNFDKPYFSASISEFWKRWHISLSTWFRDYFYISLGGNRVVKWRWYYNLFLTFLLSGLWHGANWTYVIWGGLNGFYLILEAATLPFRLNLLEKIGINRNSAILKVFSIGITYILICLAWVFFRASDLEAALYIIKNMPVNINQSMKVLFTANFGLDLYGYIIAILSILTLFFVEFFQTKHSVLEWLKYKPTAFRYSLYILLISVILFIGSFDANQQFIYFQF